MPLILRCDDLSCGREAPCDWLPSGRIVPPDGWWLVPATPPVIACCSEHVPGMASKSAIKDGV